MDIMKKCITKLYNITLLRYIAWWGSAAVLDIIILFLVTDMFGVYYMYSQIIAFLFSSTYAYYFQKFLTFRDYSQWHLKQWMKFFTFAIIWLWLNLLCMYIFVDFVGMYYILAAVLAKIIVFVRNFSMNKYFNFRK